MVKRKIITSAHLYGCENFVIFINLLVEDKSQKMYSNRQIQVKRLRLCKIQTIKQREFEISGDGKNYREKQRKQKTTKKMAEGNICFYTLNNCWSILVGLFEIYKIMFRYYRKYQTIYESFVLPFPYSTDMMLSFRNSLCFLDYNAT